MKNGIAGLLGCHCRRQTATSCGLPVETSLVTLQVACGNDNRKKGKAIIKFFKKGDPKNQEVPPAQRPAKHLATNLINK